MVSRRGLPQEKFSDKETNYKGVDVELKALVSKIDDVRV